MKKLKELKKDANPLEEYVIDYILEDHKTKDEVKSFMEDLMYGGCQSGMVGDLIYYTDTVKFFDKYVDEINELLKELISGTGSGIEELFGDKFDKEDPLIKDNLNKNLLAWFGFEETARNIAGKIGIEL